MKRTVTAALAAVALGAGLVAAPGAAAVPAAEPTTRQILTWCGQHPADCQFVPAGNPVAAAGATTQLTGKTYNCTSKSSTKQLSEAATDTTTDSVGGEVSMGLTFEVFSAGFTLSYNRTWLRSRTVTVSRTITLRPKEVGWYDRRAALLKVTGKFVYRQARPIDGAHFWIAGNVTVTGPDPANDEGDVIEQARPMTDAELKTYCATTHR